jgi:Ca2+/Na+ antiporter
MGIIQPFGFSIPNVMPIIAVLNLGTFLMLVFMVKGMRVSQLGGVVLLSTYFGMVASIILLDFH